MNAQSIIWVIRSLFMPAVTRKARKPKDYKSAALIQQLETAEPSSERLRRLVKKHPAPQQWYDEAGVARVKSKRKR
jgi:hypothetical protein